MTNKTACRRSAERKISEKTSVTGKKKGKRIVQSKLACEKIHDIYTVSEHILCVAPFPTDKVTLEAVTCKSGARA